MAKLTKQTFINALNGIKVGDLLKTDKPEPYELAAPIPMLFPSYGKSARDLMDEVIAARLALLSFNFIYLPYQKASYIARDTTFILVELEQLICVNDTLYEYEMIDDADEILAKNWSTLIVMHCLGQDGPFVSYVHLHNYGIMSKRLTNLLSKVS